MPQERTYTATDPDGNKVRFKWDHPRPPTEQDLDQIFSANKKPEKPDYDSPANHPAKMNSLLKAVSRIATTPLAPAMQPTTDSTSRGQQILGAGKDIYNYFLRPVTSPAGLATAAATAVAPEVMGPILGVTGAGLGIAGAKPTEEAYKEYKANPTDETAERLKANIYGEVGSLGMAAGGLMPSGEVPGIPELPKGLPEPTIETQPIKPPTGISDTSVVPEPPQGTLPPNVQKALPPVRPPIQLPGTKGSMAQPAQRIVSPSGQVIGHTGDLGDDILSVPETKAPIQLPGQMPRVGRPQDIAPIGKAKVALEQAQQALQKVSTTEDIQPQATQPPEEDLGSKISNLFAQEASPEETETQPESVLGDLTKKSTTELNQLRDVYQRGKMPNEVKAIDNELASRKGKMKVGPPGKEPDHPFEFGLTGEGIRPDKPMSSMQEQEVPFSVRMKNKLNDFLNDDAGFLKFGKDSDKVIDEVKKNEKEGGFSAARARLGMIQHTMKKNPYTAPIAEMFTESEDKEDIFEAVASQHANNILKIPLPDRVQSWEILNTYDDPIKAVGKADSKGKPFTQKAIQSAIDQRELTLKIHKQLPKQATPQGTSAGFIPNYITHMQEIAHGDTEFSKGFDELWNELLRNPLQDAIDFFTADKGKIKSSEGDKPSLVNRGTGTPRSPFVKTRNGKITTLETDPLRIWPIYIKSIGRLIFRKPAVEEARNIISTLSEDTEQLKSQKESAIDYTRQFAGYSDFPSMKSLTGRAVGLATRLASRATLGFSPRLQTLHIGRYVNNVFPELGTKYSARGVAEFFKNPRASLKEAIDLGLAPAYSTPFRMKTPMQKADFILYLGDMGNLLTRAISYKGFLLRNVDRGMKSPEARFNAIKQLKDSDQYMGAARYTPLFKPDNPLFHIPTQYGQIPTAIADQYARTLWSWKSNPLAVLRAAAAIAFSLYGAKKYGVQLFHMTPSNIGFTSAPALRLGRKFVTDIFKGNFEKALMELIPGAESIKELSNIGPTPTEEERQQYFNSQRSSSSKGLPKIKSLKSVPSIH